MSLSRRKILFLAGGGVVLAAGAAAGVAVSRTPDAALEPWARAGGYADPRLDALSHAILAPNPHNRQPWVADVREPGAVTLRLDLDRLLPHTDPYGRQLVIGLGCFLELMEMAAAERGHAVTTTLFPEGSDPDRLDARPVARCVFAEGATTRDPLFAHVHDRRTLKEPFDTARPVPADAFARVLAAARHSAVGGSLAEDDIAHWRAFTHEALRIEIDTPHTYRESVDLFRIGADEVEANPDGIDFSGPMFEAMRLAGLFTREAALDRSSTAYAEGLKAVFANTDTAMGHLWQVTDDNARTSQIAAGRDWLRLNLAATAEGLGVQPLSQALQEYPEMAALYSEAHDRLAPGGGTVQMLGRLGYGPQVPQSPRWPLEAKLKAG